MKKTILIFTIITISITAVLAQGDDYKKGEFYVGYSGGQIDRGFDSSVPASGFFFDREFDNDPYHGANVSAVYNVSRYIGLKADFSAAYNRTGFNVTVPGGSTFAFDTRNSLYNALGGIQIKNNSADKRFKPFVHALVGVGHGRTKVKSVICPVGVDCSGLVGGSETGLAGAFGGGLDIKLSGHIDLRLVQIDYNPIKFQDGIQKNIRLGIGIVFK
jgi:opacity protein-like surface antigen